MVTITWVQIICLCKICKCQIWKVIIIVIKCIHFVHLEIPDKLSYNNSGDSMRILIVEDNEAIAEGLKLSLECENFNVNICTSINSAKSELLKNIYNLVVLDILLPDGDGIEFCKYIKENMEIPVIFLTAKDAENDIIKGLNIGAEDYIVKPFRIGELVARINNAFRKYKDDDDILIIRNITIDRTNMIVSKNGKEIQLTSLEWRILNMLLNSIGNTISREKLLNLACDIKGNFINDNSLTVYVKRIREKLEDDINNPQIIKTIKGIGYRIENENIKKFKK